MTKTISNIYQNYSELLLKVKDEVLQRQSLIDNLINHQKVLMAWNIGKLINEYLLTNNRDEDYGQNLIKKLSDDTKINWSVLYKMRVFHQSYPNLEQIDESLSWSHYRILSGVRNENDRKKLKNLTIKQGWSSLNLEHEIRKIKKAKPKQIKKKIIEKISPVRGRLFTYPLINLPHSNHTYIDYGFKIFKNIQTNFESGKTVKSLKNPDGSYFFEEVILNRKKMNIYKAYLERVVDGDTIRVNLDLGFGILHHEILRLKAINAAEKSTSEGKKSKETLENILKNTAFLVVKTIQVDIFGRYVADVFFDEKKRSDIDPQIVADSGIYLNQLLLDKGVAKILQ